jgi:hypothetical protein
MNVPLDIEIALPLLSNGWAKLHVHVPDVEDLPADDQQFLLDLLDKFHSFCNDLLNAGIIPAAPDLEEHKE